MRPAAACALFLVFFSAPSWARSLSRPFSSRRSSSTLLALRGGNLSLLNDAKDTADAAHRRGDLGLALRCYRDALAQCDRTDATAVPIALRCRLSLALCMLKRGDARGALTECTTLLDARRPQASPTVVGRALLLRARALRRAGRPEEALTDLEVAERIENLVARNSGEGVDNGEEAEEAAAARATAKALRTALTKELASGELACPKAERLPSEELAALTLPPRFEEDLAEAAASAAQAAAGQGAREEAPLGAGGSGSGFDMGSLFGAASGSSGDSGLGGLASLMGAGSGAGGMGGGGMGGGGMGSMLEGLMGSGKLPGANGGGLGGGGGNLTAMVSSMAMAALARLKDPAQAASIAALASQASPPMIEALLSAGGVAGEQSPMIAAKLSGFVTSLTADHIVKYASAADRALVLGKKASKAWKWWRKYTDARVCAILALWVWGTASTIPSFSGNAPL